MAGCKRKLDELDDDVDSTVKKSRLSPLASPTEPQGPGVAASRSQQQTHSIVARDAGTHRSYLVLLPAEILLNIFPRCRNPCLSHVSRRLRRILPSFREVSMSLAGFAMAALPYTDVDGEPAKLDHLPIWEVAHKLYTSRWVDAPRSSIERLALQKDVFDSSWFSEKHFNTIHFLTYGELLAQVFLWNSCSRYRQKDFSIVAQQRFTLSAGQIRRVRGLRNTDLLYDSRYELSLRTRHGMSQPLWINIGTNNITFRGRGRTFLEMYTATSVSHIPAFICNLPIAWISSRVLSFIEHKARKSGVQFISAVEEAEHRLFCSRDKLRKMFSRVIEDESAWSPTPSGTPAGLQLVTSLLSLDKICYRDQGQRGVVGYELYRKVAFRNLPLCLESIFEHMSYDTDCLPNYKTLEELSETLDPEDQDPDERVRWWDTVRCVSQHAMDLYKLQCFDKTRAEGCLSPPCEVSEIHEITACAGP